MEGVSRPNSCGDRRGILGQAPFRPGPVIDGSSAMAEQVEPERHDAGGNPRGACGHDRTSKVDAGGCETCGQSVRRDECSRVRMDQIAPRNVDGVRYVAELFERKDVFLSPIELCWST